MDTQLLEAFLAVADARSFSVAADRIHLTQPAVSKRIAQLEEQLACRLFDRIARNVKLTDAGHALLPRARAILQDVADTRQLIRDLSGGISGQLRIAISHHIGLHRLPPVLKTFASRHPEVTLSAEFMDSEVAYGAILQGRFEIAVITLAPDDHPRILAHPIWQDPLQLVAAADHPLARSDASLNLDLLSQYPAILPGLGTYTGRMIKAFFDRHGLPLNASMATNYLETIKMMVSVGLGWGMLPATMIDHSLRPLACPGLTITRQLGYIHHREKSLSNATRAFVGLLEAAADSSP